MPKSKCNRKKNRRTQKAGVQYRYFSIPGRHKMIKIPEHDHITYHEWKQLWENTDIGNKLKDI